MSSPRRTVRNVLSIDGCGFRGRTQLRILEELMIQHSHRNDPQATVVTKPPSRPCDVFDLICGTATGGLIAILLGRLEMDCKQALDAYDDLEAAIFNPSDATPSPTIQDILARREPFETAEFQTRLGNYIRVATGNKDTLMRPTGNVTQRCRTLVTVVPPSAAFDTDAQRVRSYAVPRRLDGTLEEVPVPGHQWLIREAALGTTSCPRLFSPVDVQGNSFMAANTSGFTNPSLIAYFEALDLFGQDTELTLISLGMGLRNKNPNTEDQRGEFGPLSEDGIDRIIGQLGGNPADQRLRQLVSQTQLVATSAEMKHLRLNELIGRNPRQEYHRFDPDKGRNLFIFIDYTQHKAIESILRPFLPPAGSGRFTATVASMERLTAKWLEIPGYAGYPSSTHPNTLGKLVPRVGELVGSGNAPLSQRVMRACSEWERSEGVTKARNEGELYGYISCFTIDASENVTAVTGKFSKANEDDSGSTLFARVLLDDEWRFFSQRMPRGHPDEWENFREDGTAVYPVQAILTGRAAAGSAGTVTAFTSDGWYTTSQVDPRQVIIPNLSFSLPYHGMWVRTGNA